jgi:hypothetical protein
MSTKPTGITADLARASVAMLDLLLSVPGIDTDTERRAEWLRMRLAELAPDLARPTVASMIDMRISALTA